VCRNWVCSWIADSSLGPEWRPLTCKMILFFENPYVTHLSGVIDELRSAGTTAPITNVTGQG
jgi:hypothetical protein